MKRLFCKVAAIGAVLVVLVAALAVGTIYSTSTHASTAAAVAHRVGTTSAHAIGAEVDRNLFEFTWGCATRGWSPAGTIELNCKVLIHGPAGWTVLSNITQYTPRATHSSIIRTETIPWLGTPCIRVIATARIVGRPGVSIGRGSACG
jgi:hypothetical protein